MKPRTEKALGIPALIVGVVLSTGTILGWFGFHVATPSDTLENHIVAERIWQDSAEFIHVQLENVADTIHNDIHNQKVEVEAKLETQTILLESLVTRSCLRDDYEELVLQRLIPICEKLGIHRAPGVPGARDVARDTIG